MPRHLATRTLLPAALVLTLLASAVGALLLLRPTPSGAQELPSLGDLVAEINEVDGLNQLDPILNPVSDIVLGLLAQIDDALALAPNVNTLALGGEDAIDAGVAFSQATFPDGAGTAILSREDLFADPFSSGAFQGVNDAPLLYTDSGDLDPRTGFELQRLGMSNITILGGEAALHPLVVQKLEIAGLTVSRVGGPTRIETAIAAAEMTVPAATTAVLVRAYPDEGQPDSQAFADLLAAGPYAAERGWPILMTTSDVLHPATAAHLANGIFTDVVIIGGEGAVSPAVQAAVEGLGLGVTRLSGDNRYATAVAIANARGFAHAGEADQIIIAESAARDDVWAPGFAATAYGDTNSAPVLLVEGPVIPLETLQFVLDGITANLLDGGPAVVCASFVDEVACQAIGLLMLGDLDGVLGLLPDLLDILQGLPVIGDILAGLGAQNLLPTDLQALYDALAAGGLDARQLGTTLGALASGDPGLAAEVLLDAADVAGVDLDGILTGVAEAVGTVEIDEPVDGVIPDVDGQVPDVDGVLPDPGTVVPDVGLPGL